MNNPEHVKSAVNSQVSSLADDLAQLVMQEHKLLHSELKQITELADDAIHQLGKITINLKHSTEEIMSVQAEAENITEDSCRNKLSMLCDQVNLSTSETVRTLQFGDILKQLTGHVLKRAVNMDALFTSLASELVKMKLYQQQSDDHESAIEKVSAQLDFMTDQIRNYKYTLPTTNPVKQKNMKKGKIELF
jgi:hypothetical protein